MPRNMIDDRRRHPRIALPAAYAGVDIKIDSDVVAGHAYDLSISGIRVEVDDPIGPGTEADLTLDLPGQMRDVHVSAQVVWGYFDPDDPRTSRLALEFRDFATDLDRATLQTYLEGGLRLAA